MVKSPPVPVDSVLPCQQTVARIVQGDSDVKPSRPSGTLERLSSNGMNYMIAYDIAEPRRLQRVARFLERRALRCQKSVFLFHGDDRAVTALLDELATNLNLEQDCVQAWRIARDQPPRGWIRGIAASICPAGVVLHAAKPLFVGKDKL